MFNYSVKNPAIKNANDAKASDFLPGNLNT